MRIIDSETNKDIPPEWLVRYVQDSRNYRRIILEARGENFKRLGIKP